MTAVWLQPIGPGLVTSAGTSLRCERMAHMTNNRPSASDPVLAGLMELVPALETLYKDIHSHPELSMQDPRTAGVAAGGLKGAGFAGTTGIGQTGVRGGRQNRGGPTVMVDA